MTPLFVAIALSADSGGTVFQRSRPVDRSGHTFVARLPGSVSGSKLSISRPRFEDEQDLRHRFQALAAAWRAETMFVSSPGASAMNPNYRRIVELGPAALPLIFDELQSEPDYWFSALREITGQDPVPERDRGNLEAMTEKWLGWRSEHALST